MPEPGKTAHRKPWLILFLSGIVLGSSSCAGCLSVEMSDHVIFAGLLAGGFFAGEAATPGGAVVLMIRLIHSVRARKSGGVS